MPFTVHLKRKADGEIGEHQEPGDWATDANEFQWCDNNYSCDCNRFLFFERARGGQPSLGDAECGDEAYRIRVTSAEGRELYKDPEFDGGVPCPVT